MKRIACSLRKQAVALSALLVGLASAAPAQVPDLDAEMIAGLAPIYYAAVQNEDVEGLASLHVFQNDEDRNRRLETMRMMFEATDTAVSQSKVSKVSVHPDRTLAAAFVHAEAQVFNDDRTDSYRTSQDLVFLVKKVGGMWRILRVMPRSQYDAAIQMDILSRSAQELEAKYQAEPKTEPQGGSSPHSGGGTNVPAPTPIPESPAQPPAVEQPPAIAEPAATIDPSMDFDAVYKEYIAAYERLTQLALEVRITDPPEIASVSSEYHDAKDKYERDGDREAYQTFTALYNRLASVVSKTPIKAPDELKRAQDEYFAAKRLYEELLKRRNNP
ncbi:hypothetical protein JW916_00785 [Candidatus Sumerlaeota bacterium]|nr:hypothetical protein [Candidatus Sumerlaeota bacterium]